jgi:hypothetical protein
LDSLNNVNISAFNISSKNNLFSVDGKKSVYSTMNSSKLSFANNSRKTTNFFLLKDTNLDNSIKSSFQKSSSLIPIRLGNNSTKQITKFLGETPFFSRNGSQVSEEASYNNLDGTPCKVNPQSIKKFSTANNTLAKKISSRSLIRNNSNIEPKYNLTSFRNETMTKSKLDEIQLKIEEKNKKNDKNLEKIKVKFIKKREFQDIVSSKRKIRSKIYQLLSSNTIFVCPDLIQKIEDFNKKSLKTASLKVNHKVEEIKQRIFNFDRNGDSSYIINLDEFLLNVIHPQDFFEEKFSKEEINKIMEDSDYFFNDERFLKAVKMFKPKKLLQRLMEEEEENTMKNGKK